MRRTGTLLIAGLTALAVLVPVPAAHAVDPSCGNQSAPSGIIEPLPWAQRMYDPVNRLWPYSVGAGVTVAVLDSGVDRAHFQLDGRVLTGIGYAPEAPAVGDIDCVPFGTAVASIISAQPFNTVGFFGLAPGATILPVRVSDKIHHSNPGDEPLAPEVLAQGIDYAVANGANVVAVSSVTYQGDQVLEAAVGRAVAAGVVVVAAAGDGHNESEHGLRPTPDFPYPAAYDGVIGVGSVGPDGQRSGTSQIGPYVDLVAPGVDVTAAAFGGHAAYNGTGIAVGFVAAAAALMLGQPGTDLGGLSGAELVNAVTAQLFGTADGTVGAFSMAYGKGLVDPYRAMVESPGGAPEALDNPRPPPPDREALALAADRAAAQDSALRNGLLLGGLALVVLAVALFWPKARRRRWLPGRERETLQGRGDNRPEYLPGEMLFRPAISRTADQDGEKVGKGQS